MKPIRCFFGMHRYKPSEVEVYFVGDENDTAKYRAIHRCCDCGKPYEDIICIPIPKWLCRKREGEEDEF